MPARPSGRPPGRAPAHPASALPRRERPPTGWSRDYGIKPRHRYTAALSGFSAQLTAQEALR